MPPNANTPHGRTLGLLDRSAAAWLALGIGLVLAVAMWDYSRNHLAKRAEDRFEHHTEVARNTLLARLRDYEQVLRGAAALFAASDDVTRGEWRTYVSALRLDESLPGIQGTGYTVMVPASRLQAHLAAVRAEGFPDYRIQPPGERDPYSSIVYLEPFTDRNLRAFGFDMYAEPVRREAMERARDTGRAALSGKVTLVQEDGEDTQAGFLIYLPVYADGASPDDLDSRRATLHGFVYSPFRARDMMRSIFADGLRDADIEVFDAALADDTLLFASSPRRRTAHHSVLHQVEFAGRPWLVRFSSTETFEADNASAEPTLILLGGSALSLMLFAVMNSNAHHRRRMRSAAARLAASRDEFRTLVENVPGVVFRCQVGAPWAVMHISRSIEALTGATTGEFVSSEVSFGDFIEPEDIPAIEKAIEAAARERTSYEVEYRMRDREGVTRWVSERGRVFIDEHGQALWLDGVIIDITERKAAEEAMRNLAFVDTLTQLPNRRFLLDRLRQGLANSRRHGRHGALLFVDLDHFKQVNDTFGHEAGDKLLCEVARRLKQSVREGDTVARLGGDEFIVMLEDLGASCPEATDKGAVIAKKILVALNKPFSVDRSLHWTTPSIGISCFSGDDERAEDLLRRADAAMYRAKVGGRNRLETAGSPDL
ncbi:CHASE domain-containing protein [Thauera sp. WH-1]|uniref:CHASE domain-containing protein n=1 Tax=Thauera sp. WH-1 TaxID=3398230 RepID=UPI0039FD043D